MGLKLRQAEGKNYYVTEADATSPTPAGECFVEQDEVAEFLLHSNLHYAVADLLGYLFFPQEYSSTIRAQSVLTSRRAECAYLLNLVYQYFLTPAGREELNAYLSATHYRAEAEVHSVLKATTVLFETIPSDLSFPRESAIGRLIINLHNHAKTNFAGITLRALFPLKTGKSLNARDNSEPSREVMEKHKYA